MEYSILVTTNARPYCLERLLNSLSNLSEQPVEIIVGNSTHHDAPQWVNHWYNKILDAGHITAYTLASNCPPAKARKILLGKVRTEYVLVLDDDLIVTKNSYKIIDRDLINHFDVIGGTWIQWQASNYSEVADEAEGRSIFEKEVGASPDMSMMCGFKYAHGQSPDGEKFVIKMPLVCRQEIDCVIDISDVMPALFTRVDTFNRINFDEQFLYFFEWYDFSMQALHAGVRFCVRTGAHFCHVPEKYAFLAAGYHNPREEDLVRFENKWRTKPLFNG